tara:strand:+ start:303 stop:725 length:423 start_codon:yes stop_codon:yes gene_type:complete
MQFKKDHISHLKSAIDESLSSHFKQYLNSIDLDNEDLSIKVDYKSGNPSSLKFNVEIYLDEPQSQLDLKSMLSYMPNIDVEKIVEYKGMMLKMVDYKRVNRKYPFILEDLKTSKRYKFPTDWVNDNFSIEKVGNLEEVQL